MIPMTGVKLGAGPCVATLLLVMSAAACEAAGTMGGGVGDRPGNPKALAPFALVTQGSGPAGDYRVWAFRTSDGWACIEVDSMNGESGGCDPAGGPPIGGGVARNAQGIIVDGVTAAAAATTAVVRDANGSTVAVVLVDVGPSMPGVKVAVADLGEAANPAAMDFLDAGGSKVDSLPFP